MSNFLTNVTGFFSGSLLLKQYKNDDFIFSVKLRFKFYLLLAIIFSLIFIFSLNMLMNKGVIQANQVSLFNLSLQLSLLAINIGGLVLLFAGYQKLVSHILLISIYSGVWLSIIFGGGTVFGRLDTFMYVLALLTITPIILPVRKYMPLIYTLANIIILLVFSILLSRANPDDSKIINEFLADALVTVFFIGIGSYIAYRISLRITEKIRADFEARLKAEKLFARSDKRYREMAEMLPLTVFECELTGKITYVNKHGLELFGYSTDDLSQGISIFSTLHPTEVDLARKNIGQILTGGTTAGNIYTAVKKDGSCFKIRIFTSSVIENIIPVGLRGIIMDMTEQLKAEYELKSSRDQFKSLVNNIPGITYRCLYDDEWTMLYLSQEMDRFSGYPTSDFIGNKVRNFESLLYPEDKIFTGKQIDNAIKNNSSWDIEYRIIKRDGSIRWVNEKGTAIKNAEGEVEFLDGFILDITQRKDAELELKQSQDRFMHLFLNSPIALVTVSTDAKITHINKMFSNILGYNLADIEDIENWWLLAYPDERYRKELRDIWKVNIEKALETNYEIPTLDCLVKDKWGKEHYMLISGTVLESDILVSLIDITDRKLAEQNLAQSEEKFKTLLELLPYSVMLSDLEDRYYMVNKAFCDHMGFTYDEVIGKTSKELGISVSVENEASMREKLIREGFIENVEMTVSVNNEVKNTVYFSSKVIKLNNQIMRLSTSVNITEKKKIEAELENYRKNLEQLVQLRTEELAVANEELVSANEELQAVNEELYNKNQIIDNQNQELRLALQHLKETQLQLVQSEKMASLGILTAGVAHEINNPLNFIMGGYDGLLSFLDETNQLKNEHVNLLLASIKTGIDRASAIVASLNQFSRDRNSQNEACDIHQIIDNCLVMLQNETKNRIVLTKNYNAEQPVISGNSGKLHQVFVNLITNAIHAIRENGNISISTKRTRTNLFVEITDTGSGIAANDIPRITDPFFTTKEPGQGTGLGLYITYTIIKEHKGTISFTSELEKGTTVFVSFPVE